MRQTDILSIVVLILIVALLIIVPLSYEGIIGTAATKPQPQPCNSSDSKMSMECRCFHQYLWIERAFLERALAQQLMTSDSSTAATVERLNANTYEIAGTLNLRGDVTPELLNWQQEMMKAMPSTELIDMSKRPVEHIAAAELKLTNAIIAAGSTCSAASLISALETYRTAALHQATHLCRRHYAESYVALDTVKQASMGIANILFP